MILFVITHPLTSTHDLFCKIQSNLACVLSGHHWGICPLNTGVPLKLTQVPIGKEATSHESRVTSHESRVTSHESQDTHTSDSCSIKQIGVLLSYTSILSPFSTHLYTWVERDNVEQSFSSKETTLTTTETMLEPPTLRLNVRRAYFYTTAPPHRFPWNIYTS